MKKLTFLLYIFSFLIFYQCQSQIPSHNQNNNMKLIDSTFEKFDKTQYGINKDDDRKLIQEQINDRFIKLAISNKAIYLTIVIKIGWFNFYKEFYANGNIKSKGIENKTDNNGDYGIQYEFNEAGQLIKITDFDNGWQTPFVNITEIATHYAKKYNYKAETAIDGKINENTNWEQDYVVIRRKEEAEKRYWYIEFNRPHYKNPLDKKVERVVIVVDDSTGKEIKKLHYFDFYNTYFKNPLKKK